MINLDSKSTQAKLGLLGLTINVKLDSKLYTCEGHCITIIWGNQKMGGVPKLIL